MKTNMRSRLLALLLLALATAASAAPRITFLRRVPADPMSGEDWGLRSYASPATEPQPGKDVFDVYSRSPDSGLNAIPYRDW